MHDSSLIMPGPIPVDRLGTATISPEGSFEAGSMQSFTLTYTAGFYGIDDSGSLRISARFASDMGQPQFTDPTAWNYTTVEASNGAILQLRFDVKANVRPWDRTLWIKVVQGFLREGDRLVVRFGDRRQGSPGMRVQTFLQDSYEFRVYVDPIATYVFQPLPVQPAIRIVAGPPDRWHLLLPTLLRPGEPFALGLKADDIWGNPSDQVEGRFGLRANMRVANLPETIQIRGGTPATRLDGLVAAEAGDLVVTLLDDRYVELAHSNQLRLRADAPCRSYWADIHGQSEETVGNNSARSYFLFARDRAFLDVAAHQGNDFQMSTSFWNELNEITAELNEPGRFVTLPGYEWSGNTSLGGDRNVFYASEGRPIRRSSHAMLLDRSDAELDCDTAAELFAALRRDREDAICIAHCGGRYADIKLAHDGVIERAVEVHSAWGSFEWLLEDALDMGYRVGVVCNSDGHKGRPGAEYAGAAAFGAIGGLTCYLMPELTRAEVFACLRRRHHYGTSGCRLHLGVRASFDQPGTVYHDDPALGPAEGRRAEAATMGDIVHLPEGEVTLEVEVAAGAPIERIDIFSGKELAHSITPYGAAELGSRIRVIWEGAQYRGRARQVVWDGDARLVGNRITAARPINFFNRDKTLDRDGDSGRRWRHLTTGNFGGFEAMLADAGAGRLEITTPVIRAGIDVADIGLDERVWAADAQLPRRLRVYRLPDANPATSMTVTRRLTLRELGDTAIWVRVTTEDGHRAWSSPIYLFREAPR